MSATAQDLALAPLPEDLYSHEEIRAISNAFVSVVNVHAMLAEQLNVARDMGIRLDELAAPLSGLGVLMNQNVGDPRLPGNVVSSTQASVHGMQSAAKALQTNLWMLSQVLALRIRSERLNIYGALAKVQPVSTLQSSDERCDSRCQIGRGSAAAPLVRQKCCGALVCVDCLFRHNFDASQAASQLHAPCFKCSRLRGIFKHTNDVHKQ